MDQKKSKKDNQSEGVKPQTEPKSKYTKTKNIDASSTATSLIGGANTNVFTQFSTMYQQRKLEQNPEEIRFQKTVQKVAVDENILGQRFDPMIEKTLSQLQKKNDITKLKAINDLKSLLKDKDEDFFKQFLPTFTYQYKNYFHSEPNAKIMLQINQLLLQIVQSAKKSLQVSYKQLFFPWFMQQSDANAEISQISIQAFDQSFPINKQNQALKIVMNEYFQSLQTLFALQLTQVKQENMNLQEDQCCEIFQRNLVCGFNSISRYIDLQTENKQEFVKRLYELLNFGEKNVHPCLERVLSDKKFFRPRAALYDVLPVIFQNFQELDEFKPFFKEKLTFFAKHILSNLNENNTQIQRSLWNNTIKFLLQHQDQFEFTDLYQKNFLENIEKQGFCIGKPFYLNLVLVFSHIKFEKNYQNFVQKFFNNILIGYTLDENRFFSDNITNAYFECLFLYICKRAGEKDNTLTADIMKNILVKYIENHDEKMLNFQQFSKIPSGFSQLLKQNFNEKHQIIVSFCENLPKMSEKICNTLPKKINFFNTLSQICSNLEQSQPQIYSALLECQISLQNILFEQIRQQISVQMNDSVLQKLNDLLHVYQIFLSFLTNNKEAKFQTQFLSQTKENIIQLLKDLIENFCKNIRYVYKINVIEQFSYYFSKILNIMDNEESLILIIKQFFKQQTSPFSTVIASYILDPSLTNQSHFSDFMQLEDNASQISNYIQKLLKKSKQIQTVREIDQEFICDYFRIFYQENNKNYSLIPILYDLLLISNEESLQKIEQILLKFFNASKNFDKIENSFLYLTLFMNKTGKLTSPLKNFFQVCLKKSNNDSMYESIRSLQQNYFQTITQQICEYIAMYMDEEKINYIQFNIFLYNLESYLILVKEKNLNSNIQDIIDQIIQQKIFMNEIMSDRSWQLLKCVLENCNDIFDQNEIIKLDVLKEEYLWLYMRFLCSNYMYSMQQDFQLKQFFYEIQKTVENKIEKDPIYLQLFEYILNKSYKENLVYFQGAQQIINKNCQNLLINFIMNDQYQYQVDEKKMLIVFNLIDKIPVEQQILDKLVQKINLNEYHDDFLKDLGLFCSLQKTSLEEDQLQIIVDILFKHDFENFSQNFRFFVIFKFLNFIAEKQQFILISDVILKIEEIIYNAFEFNQNQQLFGCIVMITVFQFLRKVINFIEIFSDQMREFMASKFFSFCDHKISTLKENALQGENCEVFVLEMGEIISRLYVLNQHNQFPENQIYTLLNSQHPPLQKACSYILQIFYSANAGNLDPDVKELPDDQLLNNIQLILPKNLIEYLELNVNDENNLLNEEVTREQPVVLQPSHFSYVLNWIFMIYKGQQSLIQNKECISKTVSQYVEQNYVQFMNKIFDLICKLNLNEQELLKMVDKSTIQIFSPEWSNFLEKKDILKLAIHCFYLFSINYPLYLRLYFENQEKKYAQISEFCLKNFIGPSLFQSEIEQIELKQSEWLSEEFNIYVSKNTREILAIYMKESTKLEINLRIPNEYPKKQIEIECQRTVKIQEMKIKKWILRMKSLLMNQNNSIVNGLILWKDNLDKEFENIEECPICYYIIHASTKELPQLSCKTCKHKFHSTCIHKWFQTSNKSECPLCKSQFL